MRFESAFGWIKVNGQTLFNMQPGKIRLDAVLDALSCNQSSDDNDNESANNSPGSVDLTGVQCSSVFVFNQLIGALTKTTSPLESFVLTRPKIASMIETGNELASSMALETLVQQISPSLKTLQIGGLS